jgi:UDP-N-acetylglucosamine 3-dehydrogenase
MEALRIGIVGAGAIAQRNATEAAASGAAKIVGVFDLNHKVAREMAKALSAPFYPSYEALLASPDLEAVLLSVPHYLHKSMTMEAAVRGKHVLVEKPMANTLDEAKEMIACCKQNGVLLTVNYSFRYLPKIQKAKQFIDEGVILRVFKSLLINLRTEATGLGREVILLMIGEHQKRNVVVGSSL